MHELPITKSVLDQVLKAATDHEAKQITSIHITLGEFTGFVDESIEFYWKIIAKGTIASDAKFKIKRIPGKLKCLSCHQEIITKEKPDYCPNCNSLKLTIVGGDQLEITSIETD